MSDKVNTVINRIKATGLFDLDSGLSYCGDEEGYVEILEQSPYTFESSLGNLCKFFDIGLSASDESNVIEYRVVAHSIKSTARLLGYTDLFEIGLTSEMAAREMDIDKAIANHQVLVDKTNETIAMIRGFFEDVEEEKVADISSGDELTEILEAIRAAAEDFDIDGMDDGVKRLKADNLPDAVVERRKDLISAVANIDTDEVIDIIDSILENI